MTSSANSVHMHWLAKGVHGACQMHGPGFQGCKNVWNVRTTSFSLCNTWQVTCQVQRKQFIKPRGLYFYNAIAT